MSDAEVDVRSETRLEVERAGALELAVGIGRALGVRFSYLRGILLGRLRFLVGLAASSLTVTFFSRFCRIVLLLQSRENTKVIRKAIFDVSSSHLYA